MDDVTRNGREQDGAATWTDVYVKPPWIRHRLAWLVLFGLTIIVTLITCIIIFIGHTRPPLSLLLINVVMLGGSIAVAIALRRVRYRECASNIVGADPDEIALRLASELEGDSLFWDITEIPDRLAKATARFARNGHVNRILRIGWICDWNRCTSLQVQISPQILDENDCTFIELELTANASNQIANDVGKAPRSLPRFLRTITRNIEVRIGNWIGLILLGNGLAIECRLLIKTGVFSAWMAMYGIAFAILAILTLRTPSESNHQWHVVNGGLLSRRGRFGTSQLRLHLFDRRNSLLCLYQRRQGAWMVCAADSETDDFAIITRREVDMLLRAWLSPLPPPSADRLTDYT